MIVLADDPLLRDGTAAYLTLGEQVEVLPGADAVRADVVVFAVDTVTGGTMSRLSDISERTDGAARIVLVTDEVSEDQLALAVAHGVLSVLHKAVTAHPQIMRAVLDAHRGRGLLPSAFVGRLTALLRELRRVEPLCGERRFWHKERGTHAAGCLPPEHPTHLLRLPAVHAFSGSLLHRGFSGQDASVKDISVLAHRRMPTDAIDARRRTACGALPRNGASCRQRDVSCPKY